MDDKVYRQWAVDFLDDVARGDYQANEKVYLRVEQVQWFCKTILDARNTIMREAAEICRRNCPACDGTGYAAMPYETFVSADMAIDAGDPSYSRFDGEECQYCGDIMRAIYAAINTEVEERENNDGG